MQLDGVIEAVLNNRVRITDHVDEEAQADSLGFSEIYFSVLHGEIIEDYPNDKPFPSCLIYGETFSGESIHSVWAYNPANRWAVLIFTVLIRSVGLMDAKGSQNHDAFYSVSGLQWRTGREAGRKIITRWLSYSRSLYSSRSLFALWGASVFPGCRQAF